MTEKTVTFGSFAPGVNNRLEPTKLDKVLNDRSKASYLTAADNVDLDEKGYIKRRAGQTLNIAGRVHSLWGDGEQGMAVIDDQLELLQPGGTGFMRTVLETGMPRLPVSYSRGADNNVYWSNGVKIRRVSGTSSFDIATPMPVAPAVTVGVGGLAEGKYLVAFTQSSVSGESPATPAVQVDVPDGGSIVFAAASTLHVYVSAPDGDILTHQMSGAGGAIFSVTENGARCPTLNRALMPAGTIVRHFSGRLLVARDNLLFLSDPYNYGVYNPSKGFVPFPAPITMIEPVEGGFYLAADKTYFITDPFAAALQDVLPIGALPRSSGRSPKGDQVYWLTGMGVVIGNESGKVTTPQDEALTFGQATAGATLFRERDGMTHIVGTRANAAQTTAAVHTWIEAEVVRKGTIL